MEPLPSYGRGRELPGARYASFIHGNGLRDVVITGDLSLPCSATSLLCLLLCCLLRAREYLGGHKGRQTPGLLIGHRRRPRILQTCCTNKFAMLVP